MIDMAKKNSEAFQATAPIVHLGKDEFDFIETARQESPRRRCRILCHQSSDDLYHSMIVSYSRDTYVRPNRHHGKDESVLVVRGRCDIVFFNDRGETTHSVPLQACTAQPTTIPFYCRIPAEQWHSVVMHEDCLLFEATPGPFNPADTEYATWAPAEDAPEREIYHNSLAFLSNKLPTKTQLLAPLRCENEKVFVAQESIVPLGWKDAHWLRSRCQRIGLDRCRICTHQTPEDRLHQMSMTFHPSTYIRPSRHTKDESLFVLDGTGTYVFFDDAGAIKDLVRLGPLGSGRSVYCRIGKSQWHMLVPDTMMTVMETTSGPFRREDTEFPVWAPEGGAAAAAFVEAVKQSTGGVS